MSEKVAKVEKVSVRKLFGQRMEREGRYQEWVDRTKKLSLETNRGFSPCSWDAMREMGYEGPVKERALHEAFLSIEGQTKVQVQVQKERAEINEERKIEDFEEAVRSLPDLCSASVELDWIRAHPAMSRKARMRNNLDPVLITVEDVLLAPHGKAPAKSAVYALQHWANHPIDFFKTIISEQKKKAEDGAGAALDPDEDLEGVERMLREFHRQRGVTGEATASVEDPEQ
jgi:hypothetical protein